MLGLVLVAVVAGQVEVPAGARAMEVATRLGRAEVIVLLRGSSPAELGSLGGPFDVEVLRPFPRLNGALVRVTAAGLARLLASGAVRAVQLDEVGSPMLAESARAINAPTVHAELGRTGSGITVAVLDTGVDRAHADLDGGIIGEKCFVLGGCTDGGDESDLAPDRNGHGTHIIGILTGDGALAPRGIAPGAQVVAMRVFNDASVGRVSDWVAALDWVLEGHRTLGIRLVNMSLGTDALYSGACDGQQPALTEAVAALRQEGVLVVAASGNERRGDAMVAPACVDAVVAVGATYDSVMGREPDTGAYASGCFDAETDAGVVACFSNGDVGLDLLGPGSRIRAPGPGNRVAERRGTSQAAPHVTGVAALMLEQDPRLGPADLEAILERTGRPRLDTKNGLTTPEVDALAAVTEVFRTTCSRRDGGASCPLMLVCDGGTCDGTCFDGVCAIVLQAPGPLPADGCPGVGLGVAGAAAGLLVSRRRRAGRGEGRDAPLTGDR